MHVQVGAVPLQRVQKGQPSQWWSHASVLSCATECELVTLDTLADALLRRKRTVA